MLLLLGAGAAAALFCLLDAWYLLRLPLALLRSQWLQPRLRDPLREHSWAGRVLPSDLDWLLHMNNARYLREADLARCAHLTRSGIFPALRALGGYALLAGSCARHRRPLRLWERFAVRTRLLGWDDRAFYLEQRFVCARDGFLCTLLLYRLHVAGCSPAQVMEHLGQRQVDSPELPEDVQLWVRYNGQQPEAESESGLGSPAEMSNPTPFSWPLSPDQTRPSLELAAVAPAPAAAATRRPQSSIRSPDQPAKWWDPRSSAESQ